MCVLFDAYDKSGLAQQVWCAENNVNYSTMRNMRAKIARATPNDVKGQESSKTDWVKLKGPAITDQASGDEPTNQISIHIGSVTITIETAS